MTALINGYNGLDERHKAMFDEMARHDPVMFLENIICEDTDDLTGFIEGLWESWEMDGEESPSTSSPDDDLPDGFEDLECAVERINLGAFRRTGDRRLETDRRDVIESVVCSGLFSNSTARASGFILCTTRGMRDLGGYALTLRIDAPDPVLGIARTCVETGLGETLVALLVEMGAYSPDDETSEDEPRVSVRLWFDHEGGTNGYRWPSE